MTKRARVDRGRERPPKTVCRAWDVLTVLCVGPRRLQHSEHGQSSREAESGPPQLGVESTASDVARAQRQAIQSSKQTWLKGWDLWTPLFDLFWKSNSSKGFTQSHCVEDSEFLMSFFFSPFESCASRIIIILYVGTCLPSYFLSPSPLHFLPISTHDYKISISPVMSQAYWIASQCVFKIYWNPILEIWCVSYFRLRYSYQITANQQGAKQLND